MEIIKAKMTLYCLIALAFLANKSVSAQEGSDLFKKTCAACHSIGGGKLVGPDLKGVSKKRNKEWLVSFVQSSQKMVQSGDADAVAITKEFNNTPMPDCALTADQIEKIVGFIDGGVANANVTKPDSAELWADSIFKANSASDIGIGFDLFTGKRGFQNGGVACVACHNASFENHKNGGLLAKDLTKCFSRLGGTVGIKAIVASPPFPAMAQAYKDAAITPEENTYLQLFLKNSDHKTLGAPDVDRASTLHYGVVFGIFLALLIAFIWRKRKRQSVNQNILKRQERYLS